jgi:general secretion pathway protein A
MYQKYWGLIAAPFQNVPDPNFFFLSAQHREGMARLMYAVKHNKGAALLTGDVGCGKTTLSRAFVVTLAQDKFDIGLVTNPSLPSPDFLEEINLQLGITPPNTSKVAMLRALNERLLRNLEAGRDTVLIVDEAHCIRDPDVMEELRMLLNFQLNDRFLLTLILIGQPEVREIIRRIPQFDQRIAIRHHLKHLDQSETGRYITFRLEKAGAKRSIFTGDALDAVWEYSQGIPRVVNTLCDTCLLDGYASEAKGVDAQQVKRAAAGLN